jgi:16S rRNA (uracil1498-N3)-methyltransferase
VHRFAIAPERIDGSRVTFDREETRHLARVLRLGPGDLVLATDGRGLEYTVRLETLGTAATGAILEVVRRPSESPLAVTLIQGIPKGDKMEAIARAATELGVTRIVPALTAHTVVALEEGRWLERARRWQRVAREAAKQCGRAVIPEVTGPVPLVRALEAEERSHLRICLWEGDRRPLGEILKATPGPPRSAAIVVGPEGGFSRAEVAHARHLGWAIAGLGPRIVRVETASLAALAIIQSTFGDLLSPGVEGVS